MTVTDVAVLVNESDAYPSVAPDSLKDWIATSGTINPTNYAPSTSSAHALVIPTSSTSLPWYQPAKDHCIYTSIESATAAGFWKFPSNSLEHARCNIFRDLHERGYFIAGGIKFGGQYLVYPG